MTDARRSVIVAHMSEMPNSGAVPQWTLGWRLNRALAHANVSVQQMATELGVSRGTLSRWMADKGAEPRRIYVKQWALRTGVSYEWLSGSTGPATQLPRPDSDREPAGYPTLARKSSLTRPADTLYGDFGSLAEVA